MRRAAALASALEQLSIYSERGKVAFARADYDAAERWYEKAAAVDLSVGGSGGNARRLAAKEPGRRRRQGGGRRRLRRWRRKR